MIVLDTSGVFAALDEDAAEHTACRTVLATEPDLLLSPFVLSELDYLVSTRLGQRAALTLLDDVGRGAYDLVGLDRHEVAQAAALCSRYADLNLGLTDASLVVLAARHRSRRLLTLDHRHFRAVRPLQGGAFTLLPADA